MIIITGLKTIEVNGDIGKVYHQLQSPEPSCIAFRDGSGWPSIIDKSEIVEHIRGRRYVRYSAPKGMPAFDPHYEPVREEICLGMTKEVQDILGMAEESWGILRDSRDKYAKDVKNLIKVNGELKHSLKQLRDMTPWQRLVSVFK